MLTRSAPSPASAHDLRLDTGSRPRSTSRSVGSKLGLAALVLLGGLSGCASLQVRAEYRSMGEFNLAHDQEVRARYAALQSKPLAGATQVKVLVDAIPRGLQLKDGVLSTTGGYQHQVIGKFKLVPDTGFFPNYRDKWRKAVCYPQVPLTMVTLAMWYLVPTYYPCFTKALSAKTDIVSSVEKLVVASGGDLAIMSFLGERDLETAVGSIGFIIRLDPRMKDGKLETAPQKLRKEPVSI